MDWKKNMGKTKTVVLGLCNSYQDGEWFCSITAVILNFMSLYHYICNYFYEFVLTQLLSKPQCDTIWNTLFYNIEENKHYFVNLKYSVL